MDDGGDLVENLISDGGLLCARQYFAAESPTEKNLRIAIDSLWLAVEWDWYVRGGDCLYWHWSPRHGWAMSHVIAGWNECLITYVLASASPTHPAAPAAYHRGWTGSPTFRNGRTYYGIELSLGPPFGGPLFFSHYSFLGLDPRGLRDRYADCWQQNRAHTLINRAHCITNPHDHAGYGEDSWDLTACDGDTGYSAFDRKTIVASSRPPPRCRQRPIGRVSQRWRCGISTKTSARDMGPLRLSRFLQPLARWVESLSQWWQSGFATFAIGMSAAALAFCVGYGFRTIFNLAAG